MFLTLLPTNVNKTFKAEQTFRFPHFEIVEFKTFQFYFPGKRTSFSGKRFANAPVYHRTGDSQEL